MEFTETYEEQEATQTELKGFGGHYSAVALASTHEDSKVNKGPEPDRQTQAKKLICGRDRSS